MNRVLLLALTILLLIPKVSAQNLPLPTGNQPWDLFNTEQSGQFTFYDVPAGASTTGKPVDIGDFDGDGCGDIAATGHNSSHPIDGLWRGSVGHVRIIMNVCDINGVIPMNALPEDGNTVLTIFGAHSGDMTGTETYVSDFNNDGYDDLLFSAQNNDGPNLGRSNAGAIYILFGHEGFSEQGDIDLLTLPDNVIAFYGAANEDRLGMWIEGGDFDGDGIQDVIVGANQADGINNARLNAGEVFLIYGAQDMIEEYGQIVDLVDPPEQITRIIGVDYDDLMGSAVFGGDINGDGIDDAIMSAALWRASAGVGGLSFGGSNGPKNLRYNAGETFVLFGTPDLRGQTIDLATKIDEDGAPIDNSVTVIYGADGGDLLGEEIVTGDLDGDGRHDLILGTLIGDGANNNLDEAGEAWVIYTYDPIEGQLFDLAEPDPERMVAIYPDQADSKAGDTMRIADIDNDGIDDLFYGAPDYDPIGYDGVRRRNAGILAVIMGEKGGLPHNDGQILIFDPPEGLRIRFIIGADANDMMPYSLAVYDLDGDGVVDIAPNAMGGDGYLNLQVNAGEMYVINGAEFMATVDEYVVVIQDEAETSTATPLPTVEATPLPDATIVAGDGDLIYGQVYFEETCAGCHGFSGEGVTGLGLPLTTSPLVLYAPDDLLLAFLREGRPADHPDNVTGISMPPSGGRTDWGDEELLAIIAYLRHLRDNAN